MVHSQGYTRITQESFDFKYLKAMDLKKQAGRKNEKSIEEGQKRSKKRGTGKNKCLLIIKSV